MKIINLFDLTKEKIEQLPIKMNSVNYLMRKVT